MLIKSTSYLVFFNGIIRILGFLTTALLFRIYSIEEIGEYFLLISILSIFSAIVFMGADKPLIKNNLKKYYKKENQILKSRIMISLICFPIFIFITFELINYLSIFSLILLSFTLFLNSFGFDYLLLSKKKILELSIIQLISQIGIFTFFLFCFFYNSKPSIILHQLLSTTLLTLIIIFYIKKTFNFKFIPIFKSKTISMNYFKTNSIIIISILFVTFISSIDFIIAKKIFNNYEFGIMASLIKYSLLSYGFLIIINKTLFSYSISSNHSNEFIESSKKVSLIYNMVSSIILLILIYPYLRIIMNLDDVNFIILPAILITLCSVLMPNFFLKINYIESNDRKFSCLSYLIYTVLFIIFYYLIGVGLFMYFKFENIFLYFSLLFLSKWITLNIVITIIKNKSKSWKY